MEVGDHLGDRRFLVAARDQHGDARSADVGGFEAPAGPGLRQPGNRGEL
jgi:hypothetical protein